MSEKIFVGFGFGPIQTGLFLFEAYSSGNFSRYIVAEIDQSLVDAVKRNNGRYSINVARFDRIEQFTLEGIELYNPNNLADREKIIEAIAQSDELATALPNVNIYTAGGNNSPANLLAEGFSKRKNTFPTIIYTAENHNHAAEILYEKITERTHKHILKNIQTLNTVIGKMSGVITDKSVIDKMNLITITPDIERAILVEEFNKILISKITLPNYKRGIEVFIEKDDLLPFEEAKLYGHNAIHALIAYLADIKGYETIAEAGKDKWIMQVAEVAFINESGGALIQKHRNLNDPLFTPTGYREYAEDLLKRMTNPNLNDLTVRVARDPVRKLGYDDRLFGTMRLALQANIEPINLALGSAAGVIFMVKHRNQIANLPQNTPIHPSEINSAIIRSILKEIWENSEKDKWEEKLIELTISSYWKLKEMLAI